MKNYTLCDYDCPLKETCARYCPELDKQTTDHFGVNPYNDKKGICNFYEPYDPNDIDEVTQILKFL